MKILSFYRILFFFLVISIFYTCTSPAALKLFRGGEVVQKSFHSEIPLELHKNLPVVNVKIGSKNFKFLFDTGADVCVVADNILKDISYQTAKKMKVGDASNKKKKLEFITLSNMKIGGVNFTGPVAVVTDFTPFQDLLKCSTEYHGIIGCNIFRHGVWKINYQEKIIEFADDISKLEIDKKTIAIPIECGKLGSTNIPLVINGEEKNFEMDTGFTGDLSARTSLLNKLDKPKQLPRAVSQGLQSQGLNGKNFGEEYEVMFESIKMGDFSLPQKMINFGESKSFLIGNNIWANFEIIKDWKNCQLFLSPIKTVEPDTLSLYEYELRVDYTKQKLLVSKKWINHPSAFELEQGVEVLRIENFDLSDSDKFDFCDFTENTFIEIIKRKTIQITVLKDGKEKEVQLNRHQFFK